MKVETIKINKKQALKEWKDYIEILKTRKEKYLREMKQLYFHAKRGKRIIDIYAVFKATGLNEKDEPKLAISPIKLKEINFRRWSSGEGAFKKHGWNWSKFDVSLPTKTFSFKLDERNNLIASERIRADVPIVPARILKSITTKKLSDFYILWECNNWEERPRDPILLKRISQNLFVVFAVWNLTTLERSVIK